METCQLAEGIHYIPKGSEYCVCGRTSRTFPDPRDLDAWRRQRDSAAEPAISKPASVEAEAAVPAPEATAVEAPKPKKSRSKAAPPAAPTTPTAP